MLQERRFLNNLAVLLDSGKPLLRALEVLEKDLVEPEAAAAYRGLADAVRAGADLDVALGDYPLLCSRTSLALVRAGVRSGTLPRVLFMASDLVRRRMEGDLAPTERFFETWADLLEAGLPLADSLEEVGADFEGQSLGRVAADMRRVVEEGGALHEVFQRYPNVFSHADRLLLEQQESGALIQSLRAILRLI